MLEETSESQLVLAPVDEPMLEKLEQLALSEAAADEVTPPLGEGTEWNQQRVDWFRDFHRQARAGLDGPNQTLTWAILREHELLGSVRLASTHSGHLETGIWLARTARGRGLGSVALALVLAKAREFRAAELLAQTTRNNRAARAILAKYGASEVIEGNRVSVLVPLDLPQRYSNSEWR